MKMKQFTRSMRKNLSDANFLHGVEKVEVAVSKVLSIAMVMVTIAAVVELCLFLGREIFLNDGFTDPDKFFSATLIKVFGLFLNVLIALEILENITGYLKKHVIQLELVIVTSLTAVARKIIIFDLSKSGGFDLIGLALAILALSVSYWLVRRSNRRDEIDAQRRERAARRNALEQEAVNHNAHDYHEMSDVHDSHDVHDDDERTSDRRYN